MHPGDVRLLKDRLEEGDLTGRETGLPGFRGVQYYESYDPSMY